jgi:molecular chaperone GrpE
MNAHQDDAPAGNADIAMDAGTSEAGDPEPSREALEQELEAARTEAEAAREQQLRAVAELENVRRRAARDVENAHKYGIERLASELLAVKDSMEMGLQAAEAADEDTAVVDGLRATLKLLDQCLAKFGISVIDPEDEAFDPEFHEAMAAQPSASHEPGAVMMVVQKGYRIHDRLLRPARVIVSRAAEE